MFQVEVVEKIRTHIFCLITPPNRAVYEIMSKKYCRAGQVTDDNMAYAHCMLNTKGYKYTLLICNMYCFSAETMVVRTRLNVTFMRTLFCLVSYSPV